MVKITNNTGADIKVVEVINKETVLSTGQQMDTDPNTVNVVISTP